MARPPIFPADMRWDLRRSFLALGLYVILATWASFPAVGSGLYAVLWLAQGVTVLVELHFVFRFVIRVFMRYSDSNQEGNES